MDVVRPLFAFVLVLVVNQLMSRSDDVFLALQERFHRLTFTAATAATTAATLTLIVFASEWPDFDEVDICRNRICGIAGIHGFAVIRHEIPGLQIVFLEKERV